MATTKVKESTIVKEKKGAPCSTSEIKNDKRITKQSKPISLNDKETSTESKKSVPSYLKPTLSSIQDPLKQSKKHGAEDPSQRPNPIRRRSFDKPPSASRVQNPHISPGPRARVPSKFPASSTKTSPKSKPHLEKTLKTPSKSTKVQPHSVSTLKKTNVANKKGPTWVPRKEVSHTSHGSTQTSPKSETNEEEKQSPVHEIEKELQVPDSEISNHGEPVTSDTSNIQEHEEVKSDENASEEENKVLSNAAVTEETEVENNEEKDNNGTLEDEDDNNDRHQEEDSTAENKEENEAAIIENQEEVDLGTKAENQEELKPDNELEIQEQKSEASNVSKPQASKKKDSSVYNDVIEETTSKLMEKKQNKVLALAGAFQSVIDAETSSK